MEDFNNITIIRSEIKKIVGFDCSGYTENFIFRRLDARVRATNQKGYFEYFNLLKTSKDEQRTLLDNLYINVTNFFRDKEFWETFKNTLIQEIKEKKKSSQSKEIKIWSAGCSTGEEPYTIIIQFLEKFGNDINNYGFHLIGTDIDSFALEKAREGIYEMQQFREMDDKIREKYFDKVGENYKIKDHVKNYATFQVFNLLEQTNSQNFDIIFCRNTVIYFEKEAKEKLYVKFFNALKSPGFFIMGLTESLQGAAKDQFKVYDLRQRIYQKE